jgi:hypothetical protein
VRAQHQCTAQTACDHLYFPHLGPLSPDDDFLAFVKFFLIMHRGAAKVLSYCCSQQWLILTHQWQVMVDYVQ